MHTTGKCKQSCLPRIAAYYIFANFLRLSFNVVCQNDKSSNFQCFPRLIQWTFFLCVLCNNVPFLLAYHHRRHHPHPRRRHFGPDWEQQRYFRPKRPQTWLPTSQWVNVKNLLIWTKKKKKQRTLFFLFPFLGATTAKQQDKTIQLWNATQHLKT